MPETCLCPSSSSSKKRLGTMQSVDERRRNYCANCGKEIKPGQGIVINDRFSVCSLDCETEFKRGKIL